MQLKMVGKNNVQLKVNVINMQDFLDWKKAKDKEEIINNILELKKMPQTVEIKLTIQKLQQRLSKRDEKGV